MGYESKFYVVEKSTIENGGKIWGEVIAMFDMSKLGCETLREIKEFAPTNTYIYADDGNTRITEDMYGDELIEIPIPDMITILKGMTEREPGYRRIKPFKKMLKGFNKEKWKDVVVLHYGY